MDRLHISAANAGKPISLRLFGIFYEDLNHAGEGGLYAEMVQNRAFNHPEPLNSWEMITAPGSEGTMGPYYNSEPTAVNHWGLCLRILSMDGGRVGVANGGYWGMAVAAGKAYRLTLDAWCSVDFAGALTATLESATGEVYARAEVPALTTQKQRLTITLTASGTDPQARLVLAAETTGTLWFDFVSLFPVDTWKGRPNGMRADLAEMMAALRPSFMRFPGGCFVEGDQLSEAFRWKENLGDLAQRKGHWNRWGYHSSAGIGFHEYLQLCEDLGAEPLFVVNAGMSHTDTVPEAEIDQWVQDAVDAIEYANGPATSPWGARRAGAGHPAPFNLRFIEIGNENGGPLYHRNYPRFYQAIKVRFPEIRIISNVPIPDQPVEIIDEHFFATAAEMAEKSAHFDRYDRQGPKIYVGEYAACHGDCGIGNLRSALGEAAFMTGLERNGDVVEMASFAPLFVNVRDRHWEVDAIGFDTARCYGTPSYYVQQLFSQHRIATLLPMSLDGERDNLFFTTGRNLAGDIIIKAVNMGDTPREMVITLDGVQVAFTGLAIELSGDPDAANTLNNPRAVVPTERPLSGLSPTFSSTFPAHSLTIMRIGVEA